MISLINLLCKCRCIRLLYLIFVNSKRDFTSAMEKNSQVILNIVRLRAHRGSTYGKNRAIEIIQETYGKVDANSILIAFVDSEIVASDNWLTTIGATLEKYPNALVYPVMDVLTITADSSAGGRPSTFEVVPADNVVAAFDWSMQSTWEPVHSASDPLDYDSAASTHRIKFHPSVEESSIGEMFSPAVPSVFAVRLSHFVGVGKFDSSLRLSTASPDNVELSIRNWLCGGVILRQSCSRVAVATKNMFSEGVAKGEAVTQESIDKSVMTIANKWLDSQHTGASNVNSHLHYKELVYQARFVRRVPYAVETSVDPVHDIPYISSKPGMTDASGKQMRTCLSFDWYLSEVFPGLLEDAKIVLDNYKKYLGSEYLESSLKQQLTQYSAEDGKSRNDADATRLRSRERLMQNDNPIKEMLHTSFKKVVFTEPPVSNRH